VVVDRAVKSCQKMSAASGVGDSDHRIRESQFAARGRMCWTLRSPPVAGSECPRRDQKEPFYRQIQKIKSSIYTPTRADRDNVQSLTSSTLAIQRTDDIESKKKPIECYDALLARQVSEHHFHLVRWYAKDSSIFFYKRELDLDSARLDPNGVGSSKRSSQAQSNNVHKL
jgi:hypothetical protein